MAILDFKEIPEAHIATGEQDQFELFAQEFFELMGYEVVRRPARGADGGCDLILEEVRKGVSGETRIRWLVSCKHKAHSGTSVSKTDEPEISDSVASNGCEGFIGFYSTLPSSGLVKKVEGIEGIAHQFFNSSRIEQELLTKNSGEILAKRFFPVSYAKWLGENPGKAQIFSDSRGLQCLACGEDITDGRKGIIVSWERIRDLEHYDDKRFIKAVYWCCKGACELPRLS